MLHKIRLVLLFGSINQHFANGYLFFSRLYLVRSGTVTL